LIQQSTEINGKGGIIMVSEKKLNISSQVELSIAEERLSKQKAKHLFESG
jgi:hypothetical protein